MIPISPPILKASSRRAPATTAKETASWAFAFLKSARWPGTAGLPPLSIVRALLRSRWHEERLLAVILLVDLYARGDSQRKEAVYRLYCDNLRSINNWDIVDASAPRIVGPHLEFQERSQLYVWAASSSLWERRIAIMASFHFIRQGDFTDALALAEMLLGDPEDLLHKAVGWMLREVGNRDRAAEEAFLARHAHAMPRTMLRYAIEKFPERSRKAWLGRRSKLQ